jgi:hypothetical protein
MQFLKGKPPETHYATRPGARAKRREVALGRPGFEREANWSAHVFFKAPQPFIFIPALYPIIPLTSQLKFSTIS